MNTPTHTIINLVLLKKQTHEKYLLPVILGSLFPDFLIMIFYFYQKIIKGIPEEIIWGELYFEPGWQIVFDIAHSIPVFIVFTAVFFILRQKYSYLFCLSVVLHALFDLPFHNDDAHRHFYPISGWKFESPVSYWDPEHFGLWFTIFEALLFLAGVIFLIKAYKRKRNKWIVAGILAVYFLFFIFAFFMWVLR